MMHSTNRYVAEVDVEGDDVADSDLRMRRHDKGVEQ
jgi:hypothetical protein